MYMSFFLLFMRWNCKFKLKEYSHGILCSLYPFDVLFLLFILTQICWKGFSQMGKVYFIKVIPFFFVKRPKVHYNMLFPFPSMSIIANC